MPRGELHVQLYVNYADDEKLVSVSRNARLLYVDALCQAKRQLNDGRMTPKLVEKLMYPERPAVAEKTAAELVNSGAWTWDEQARVYVITAWLKRNKSAEQIRLDRAAAEESALLGNHRRWHEARGVTDSRCRLCSGTPSDPRSGMGSGTRSGVRIGHDSTETETETETEKKNKRSSSPAKPATDSPEFTRFWDTYPRHVGKGAARKAWARATKNTEADSIIASAEKFAAQCTREQTEQRFIPHPATWLNAERWADAAPAPTAEPQVTHGWWDN